MVSHLLPFLLLASAETLGYNQSMSYNAYLPPANPAQIAAVHRLIHVTPSMLRYDRSETGISLSVPILELVLLVAILHSGLAGRVGKILMHRSAERLFLTGLLFWIGLHVFTTLILFPLNYYAGFVLPAPLRTIGASSLSLAKR